jgi:hypothetical protein
MLEDKLGIVKCKFSGNVISYHEDRMLLHLGYWYDGNGQVGVIVCSRAQPWVKALFAWCGRLVLPPLNDMEVLAHFLDGQIKNVTIETSNHLLEGKFVLMFQIKRAWIPLETKLKKMGPPKSKCCCKVDFDQGKNCKFTNWFENINFKKDNSYVKT